MVNPNYDAIKILQLSHESVLKSDWYCQLQGSRSQQFEVGQVARLMFFCLFVFYNEQSWYEATLCHACW